MSSKHGAEATNATPANSLTPANACSPDDESKALNPDIIKGLEETDSPSKNPEETLSKVEQMQLRQKQIEEENKRKKALLAKAIADRYCKYLVKLVGAKVGEEILRKNSFSTTSLFYVKKKNIVFLP